MKIGRNEPCPCGSGNKYKKCCLGLNRPISLARQLDLKGKNAENFVYELTKKSFLIDWCYPTPKLPNNKELCDLLIVYDDTAIIWQIKDLKLENGQYKQSEVKENINQLSTSKRRLLEVNWSIELENPRRGKEIFNPEQIKKVYLISALLGSGEDSFSFAEEVNGKMVHTFTREFTEIVLSELDTIQDFVEYLRKKEELLSLNNQITLIGGEKELLAVYLMNNRSYEEYKEATLLMVDEGSWDNLVKKPEYIAKKKEDEISYGWDSIINIAHTSGEGYEIIARELARPSRFERRQLSKSFSDAHLKAHNEKVYTTTRRIMEVGGTTYCFVFLDEKAPREMRKKLIQKICFAARGMFKNNKKVIGIATEMKIEPTCSYDFCLLELPEWSEESQKKADMLKKDYGILANTKMTYVHEDEYPQVK